METTSGRVEEKRRPPKARGAAAMVLYVLTMIVAASVVSTLLPDVTTRTVSYSDFKQMLRANEIAEVTIGDSRIHGTLKKTERRFATVRVMIRR